MWAEPIAYGPLNLLPDIFENLQPHEFMQLWDGYKWRKEDEENKLAYFTSAQMSVHTKDPVKPKALLDQLRPKNEKKWSKAEDEDYLKKKFKGKI